MRNALIFLLASVSFLKANSQKSYSLSASGNFDFLVSGLGTNNGGLGIIVHSNFFTKDKLQLGAEVSLDQFLGSKLLMVDSLGNNYGNTPAMLSLKLGPEFFITKNTSLAALYGYTQYNWFDATIRSGSLKFSLTTHPRKHPKMLIGFSFTKMTGGVHFFAISVGSKIL